MCNPKEKLKEDQLEEIINEYKKSIIQSEDEVRSKLIVPLIEWLDFPSELRAENFPVYGWNGCKMNSPKKADFILFSSKEFAYNRSPKPNCLKWVHDHSLLVFEAKKTEEMPDFDGQTIYYTQWTKAIGYLVSDGNDIRGYYYSDIAADYVFVNCKVEELVGREIYSFFSYTSLINKKKKYSESIRFSLSEAALEDYKNGLITSENIELFNKPDFTLPAKSREKMRCALSLDGSISDFEVIKRFLRVTDTILDCDLRRDIPEYALFLPRKTIKGKLYVDDEIIPSISGEATLYYRNDTEIILFDTGYMTLHVVSEKNYPYKFQFTYSVKDKSVDKRIVYLKNVKKVIEANTIRLLLDDSRVLCIELYKFKTWKKGKEYKSNKMITEFWIREMEKMLEIQRIYCVQFVLQPIEGHDKIVELYNAVDNVYDGIVGNQNCYITISCSEINKNRIKISEPFFLEEGDIPLSELTIHNITFSPCASMVLPCTIEKRKAKNGLINIPACCAYNVAGYVK